MCFTELDLTWEFPALPVVEEDQHKIGPDGEVYVWTKAAMGLKSFPSCVPTGHGSPAA